MLERDFQNAVVELARLGGWLVHHTRTVQIAGGGWSSPCLDKGFPDLTLVKRERLLFAELKTETGRLTLEQIRWLEALRDTGADARVWRPSQWNEIVETLTPTRSNVRHKRPLAL